MTENFIAFDISSNHSPSITQVELYSKIKLTPQFENAAHIFTNAIAPLFVVSENSEIFEFDAPSQNHSYELLTQFLAMLSPFVRK